MGKRIISLQEAQSITNNDYLVIDNQSGGTKKVSAGFINDIVSDVEVDGASVVNNGVAEIDLSGKQDTIVAGSNITIAADGKTISATDTTYTAGTNVQINNGVISATDTTYTAGTNVDITGGVISATDTTYTAGANVTIDANNEISATDTTYTAGTNVQINNGVISATDTTYSAFGGATAGADGSSGLVPQPLIADKDKFLKGDGTWDTIQPGASALDDLTNVDITSPTNGQVLKYDSTNQEWVNANESGGGGGSTVTITPTLSTGTKIADYSIDGSTGALYAPNGGGGSSTLSGLSDVTITSPTDGQGLVYDATNQVWVNGDVSGGGGGNIDTLWSGSVAPTTSSPETVTLAHSIADYDYLIFDVKNTTTSAKATFVAHNLQVNDEYLEIIDDINQTCCYFIVVSNTSITLGSFSSQWGNSTTYTGIYGVKHGSGGGGSGSGDTFITYSKSVTTTQYGWWVVEDEDGNTLDPDTYVIIDISVNVRYYDVLWYQDSTGGDYRATLFDINDGNTVRSSSTRTWTITYAKKDFAAGGSAAISGITPPTSSQGSNGDIYMQYKAGEVSTTIFSGTEHSTAYANPIEISVPNASMYNSFDITCLYYYWSSQPIFDGTDSIDYADLESGQAIFMPSIDDPNTGVMIKLENDTFYIYPSTGYNLYVYEVVGHASGAPTKINHLYGKISNSWIESSNAEEITLPDYNNLTTAQKNDGTIRFIPKSNIGTSNVVDTSNVTNAYIEGAMSLTSSSDEIAVVWNGNSNCGLDSYLTAKIDVTDYDYITYNLTTGNTYDYINPGTANPIRNLGIGLCSTTPSTSGWTNQTQITWAASNIYSGTSDANRTMSGEVIDVSSLTGEYYLVMCCAGWSFTIEDLTLATAGGNVSQIRYMSNTYAEVDVAEEITLADYNALTTDQKNDGKIRFIPAGSGGGVTTPYDMSSIVTSNTLVQQHMSVTATSSTKTTIAWNGGSNIGCTYYYTTPIDLTNYGKVTFSATTDSSYNDTYHSDRDDWHLQVGFQSSAPTQAQTIVASSPVWAAVADMDEVNHTFNEEIDVSELSGSYYLVVNAHGWNATIDDITLDSGGAYPSQIKYMSKTYADGTGGSGGSYDTTTLFTGSSSTTSGELSLSDSIDNYDMLMFMIGWDSSATEAQVPFIIDRSYFSNTYVYNNGGTAITDPHMLCCTYQSSYIRIKCGSANNKILIYDSTDSAVYKIIGINLGGGSSSVSYSTAEQEIGTWIDDSPLYQKTINIVNSSSVSAIRDVDLSTYVPSGARVLEFSGMYEYVYLSNNYGMAIGNNIVYGYMWEDEYRLKINFGSGSFESDEINLTIKYTKASS